MKPFVQERFWNVRLVTVAGWECILEEVSRQWVGQTVEGGGKGCQIWLWVSVLTTPHSLRQAQGLADNMELSVRECTKWLANLCHIQGKRDCDAKYTFFKVCGPCITQPIHDFQSSLKDLQKLIYNEPTGSLYDSTSKRNWKNCSIFKCCHRLYILVRHCLWLTCWWTGEDYCNCQISWYQDTWHLRGRRSSTTDSLPLWQTDRSLKIYIENKNFNFIYTLKTFLDPQILLP